MRIVSIADNVLIMSNPVGIIKCVSPDDYCYNYADFHAGVHYDVLDMEFEYYTIKPHDTGFIIELHNAPHRILGYYTHKIWIPCYSGNNGYYSYDLDVAYCGAGNDHCRQGGFGLQCSQEMEEV